MVTRETWCANNLVENGDRYTSLRGPGLETQPPNIGSINLREPEAKAALLVCGVFVVLSVCGT